MVWNRLTLTGAGNPLFAPPVCFSFSDRLLLFLSEFLSSFFFLLEEGRFPNKNPGIPVLVEALYVGPLLAPALSHLPLSFLHPPSRFTSKTLAPFLAV